MFPRCLLIVLLLLGLGYASAAGQEGVNPEAIKHRNDCRLAAQVLTTGHPAPHYDWAFDLIGSCGPGAAPAIASVWDQPPTEVSELNRLYYMSQKTRDRRIFDAVLSVAEDATRPELVRLTALGVLAAYTKPGLSMDLRLLQPVSTPLFKWQNIFGFVGSSIQEEGEVPLPGTAEQRIVEVLRKFAAGKENTPLRDSAWHLVHFFEIGG